jgi:hypothetical protein
MGLTALGQMAKDLGGSAALELATEVGEGAGEAQVVLLAWQRLPRPQSDRGPGGGPDIEGTARPRLTHSSDEQELAA